MAKQVKDKTEPTGISAEDLKRVIGEAIQQKQSASEYAGMHGKVVANAVETYGIDKTAFTLSRRLSEMEEGRRAVVVRSCLDYWYKLGMFDQIDAFDDVTDTLRAILAELEAGKGTTRNRDGDIRLAFSQ
jgi:hypothetical protein